MRWSAESTGLLALAVAGALVTLLLFPRLHPLADGPVEVNRSQALDVATAQLQTMALDPLAYDVVNVVFRARSMHPALAAASDLSGDQATLLLAHRPLAYWEVLYLDESTDEVVEVEVGADGRVVTYDRRPPANLPGAQATPEAALEQARAFLADHPDYDLAAMTLVDTETVARESRTDYTFTWQVAAPALAETRLRISVTIHGDGVGGWRPTIIYPPAFETRYLERSNASNLFQFWQFIVASLVAFVALIVFALRFRARELGMRGGAVAALLLLGAMVLVILPTLSVFRGEVLLQENSDFSIYILYLGVGINTVFTALGLFFVWVSGESEARELWPEKLRVLDGLLARRGRFPALGCAILRGVSLGMGILGVTYLSAWLFARQPGVWVVPSPTEIQLFSGALLLPGVVGAALAPALLLTGFVALFALGWLTRRFKRRWPAFALVLIATGLLFTGDPLLLPRTWTGLSGIIGFVLLFVFFVRYDVATLFVGTFVVHLVPMLLLLGYQPNGQFQLAAALGASLLALLGLWGVLALRGRPLDERAIEPTYVRYITERERLKMELDIARRAQLRMLPREIPRLEGLDVAAFSEPAREVGGDYYDFFDFGPRRLGVTVGDVSGKGMPAALYMTMLKGSLQSRADANLTPHAILSQINRTFFQSAEPNVFVTLVYAVLDLERRELRLARAGHQPLLVYRPQDGSSHVLQPPGIGIGLERGSLFDRVVESATLPLCPGDVIVLFSDGLVEARNGTDEEFGQERVLAIMEQADGASAETILRRIREAHAVFTDRSEPEDDLTCLVVRVS